MRIEVNGQRMFVDVDGAQLVVDGDAMRERPVVLLLHGGPGFDHSGFKPDFERLTEVAQVVYVDHSGQGRSDRTEPAEWRLDRWADDVEGLCQALGLDHPVILGWSFGGMVAMNHAARYPDRPAKLILQSTAARLDVDLIEMAFGRAGGADAGAAARAHWVAPTAETMAAYLSVCLPLYSPLPLDPAFITRSVVHPELSSGGWTESLTYDLRPLLDAITCPVLVIAGALDPITPPEAADEIVEHLPPGQVTYELFEGAGHFVQAVDADRFFATVSEFVSS